MARKALVVENFKASIGKFTLSINDFSVDGGSVMCLMGPNGSGKTSFLRALCGLLKGSGKIKVDGKDIAEIETRRMLAYISQSPNLFKGTVYENIAYPLKVRRIKKNELKKSVNSIAERLGITDLLNKYSYNLSGGEARKISLARSFVYKPRILLLDEPLSNLDKENAKLIFNDIKALLKKNKTTAVYVSHSNEETLGLGNELSFMKKGRIIQKGPVLKVISEPKEKVIADYLGTENILKADVDGWNKGLAKVNIDGKILHVVSDTKRGKVFFCLRPSDIFISKADFNGISARNKYEAKVESLKNKNSHIEIKVNCGFNLKAHITKQSVEELAIRKGVTVKIYFKATAAHLISR